MLSRRQARENAFIALFSSSFGALSAEADNIAVNEAEIDEDAGEFAPDEFGKNLLALYAAHDEQVDSTIEGKLKGWRVDRLSRVSLAILRLSVTEMLYGEPDMDSVIINEAVELSKRFGDEGDYQFINGLLGAVSRERGGAPGGDDPGQTC